jgi:hypothetical protein
LQTERRLSCCYFAVGHHFEQGSASVVDVRAMLELMMIELFVETGGSKLIA